MKKVFLLLFACCACLLSQAQGLHWTPVDEGLYSGSTTIIAVVSIDGVEQTSTQIELAVFSGDECRGTAMTGEFSITHRYIAQVNVYGENGHTLTFKAYNHATDQELVLDSEVIVTFTEDGSGTLFAPLELNFSPSPQILVMHWTPVDEGLYSGSTTIIAVVSIDGVEQTSTQIELAVFSGDECRGTAMTGEFSITHRYIAQVNVYGENGHTLTFKAYNHATDQELVLDSEVIVTFTEDGSGTLFAPMELNFVVSSSSTIHNTTSGSWNDPNSWGGTVPTASATVAIDVDCVVDVDVEVANLSISDGATLTIQSGNTLTVTGDLTNTTVTGLVIEDGAQVINESTDVKATCQKGITSYDTKSDGGWYTMASPVDEMAIAGSDFLTPAYDLYRYNENPESGLEWENYKDNSNVDFTTFENGRGYLYANSNTFSPTFVGTLNAASVARTLTCSESPDGLSGFNLIGNPFPHAIYKGEGGAIDNANLASGFLTLNDEGAWHVNTYEDAIMPGQGILVKTTANTNLTIVKSNTEATAESNGAKNTIGRIGITVTGGNGEDRAFVYFGQGIGLNKMRGFTDQTPILWVRDNNTDYAIAHVDNTYESLDLFFHNKTTGEYRLSVSTKDVAFGLLQLVDNITGEVIDLKQHPNYGFHANGNEMDGRFKLIFRVTTGVEEMTENEPFAFISNGQLIINGEGTLQIIDALGRQCYAKELSTSNFKLPTANFLSGIYVLRLINGNETRIQKIVIK